MPISKYPIGGRGWRPKSTQQYKMILTKKERNEIWKLKMKIKRANLYLILK